MCVSIGSRGERGKEAGGRGSSEGAAEGKEGGAAVGGRRAARGFQARVGGQARIAHSEGRALCALRRTRRPRVLSLRRAPTFQVGTAAI